MAFRKKAGVILTHKPDILIVPECEHPNKLIFQNDITKPTQTLWFGTNQHKGLGIFSYSTLRFKVNNEHNENLRMVIPIKVTSGSFNFNLFAIWAYNPNDKEGRYIEQVRKGIFYYEQRITNRQTLLIGDFNSNTIWDKKHRASNHSNIVRLLEEREIFSLYHLYFKQTQGNEQHPTLYMYRHRDKPYHIDYCFASIDLVQHLHSVEIGNYDFWTKYSDHVPVMITFEKTLQQENQTSSEQNC